jgi:RIO kinase 1
MGKHGRHGRKVQEAAWKNAEVDALYRAAKAGVRVPKPQGVYEGVLLMELVLDQHGNPAPRLNEVEMTAPQAHHWYAFMISQIVLMLCVDLIHGDLSEYNVLVDVNNMRASFARAAPELLATEYAHEMWQRYRAGDLQPDTLLTGRFVHDTTAADVDAVLEHIEGERLEAAARQLRREAALAS